MAAAYSMDLRERVITDSDAGLSSKELAERYHVSATVCERPSRWRRFGRELNQLDLTVKKTSRRGGCRTTY
jgi:hypothetical protein